MHWRERLRETALPGIPGTAWERRSLFALLALAAVLRMWDLPHIPFMHDEISALLRLYPTLGETIRKGVIELDTHPPGVQVFEWVWTRVFGDGEAQVKLPFMCMSILSILLLYRFASAWIGTTPALIASTIMATLQYFVLYGQIARPYAFGSFTTSLLADQATRYLAWGRTRNLVYMVVATVLSMYAHHFALMQAGLMGATSVLLASPPQRKRLLIGMCVAVLAYLPNVPILLHQFAQGGLGGWLQPPDRHWPGDLLWWIAHCSWITGAVLLGVIALSVADAVRRPRSSGPFVAVCLVWGLVPLIVGIGYSIWRAPVVQYSTLLFSFPFLLILSVSGIRQRAVRVTASLCLLIAATNVFTLITVRKHHALLYRSKYEAFVRDGLEALHTYGRRCLVLLDAPDEVIAFYMDRRGLDRSRFPYVSLRAPAGQALFDHLESDTLHDHLFIGASSGAQAEDMFRAALSFPRLLERKDLFEGQTLLLAKGSADGPGDATILSTALPGSVQAGWHVSPEMGTITDTTEGIVAWDQSGREFGIEFTGRTDTLVEHPMDQLVVFARVRGAIEGRVHLIAELKLDDRTVFYRGDDLVTDEEQLVVAVSPADALQRERPLQFKGYLWNEGKSPLQVVRIGVARRPGDPVLHALYGPIRGPWTYR